MADIKVILIGDPGVGKTKMINEAIRPWCKANGFAPIESEQITSAALDALRQKTDKICIIEHLSLSQARGRTM